MVVHQLGEERVTLEMDGIRVKHLHLSMWSTSRRLFSSRDDLDGLTARQTANERLVLLVQQTIARDRAVTLSMHSVCRTARTREAETANPLDLMESKGP